MANINTTNEFIQKALYYDYFPSFTDNAVQTYKTPTEFPCCPKNVTEKPLEDYLNNLQKGSLFSENKYYKSNVIKTEALEEGTSFLVACRSINKDQNEECFCVFEVTYNFGFFIHQYERKFDSIELVNKYIDYSTGKIPFDDNDFDLFEFEYM